MNLTKGHFEPEAAAFDLPLRSVPRTRRNNWDFFIPLWRTSALMIAFQDDQLLLLLKSNDEAAFTEIYNRYWQKLFVVAMHRLANPEEAREIVQDIFCNLWKRRQSLRLDHTLNTYLSTAVKYEVINRLAGHQRQQRLRNQLSKQWLEASKDTENQLQFNELQDQLAALVKTLPEKCRIIFQLSRDSGYSQKKIALKLGIAEKTVEAHLANALRKLRTGLSHLFTFFF